MRLENKIAIVTGAAAGIGAATARLFAKEGAKVVVADFDGAGAETIAAGLGNSATAVRVDVRQASSVRDMIAATKAAFGRLDILVNNAGKGVMGTVVTTEEAAWDDIMATNLKSVYLCSKHAIPLMREGGGGTIVNTASNVAQVGIPNRAAYVASKGGVTALTRAMALDHVADKVRVNAVAPGVVWSDYYERMLKSLPDPEAFVAGLKARSPMGRMGTPEEIAHAILYLAADESAFANGSTLTIDGAHTAW